MNENEKQEFEALQCEAIKNLGSSFVGLDIEYSAVDS